MSENGQSASICGEIIIDHHKDIGIYTPRLINCENPGGTALGQGVETEIFVDGSFVEKLVDQDENGCNLFEKLLRVCRCCLSEGGNLKSIFDEENCVLPMLLSLAPVQIAPNDGLPPNICETCLDILSRAVQFKQQIENADMSIRHYIAVGYSEGLQLQMMDIEQLAKTMSDNVQIEIDNVKEADHGFTITHEVSDSNNAGDYLFLADHIAEDDYIEGTNSITEHIDEESQHVIDEIGSIKEEMIKSPKKNGENYEEVNEIDIIVDEQEESDEESKRRLSRNKNRIPTFADKENEEVDMVTLENVTKISCPICHRNFKNNSTLECHLRCHSKESNDESSEFQCSICGAPFTNESDLHIHGSIHVQDSEKLICRGCEKEFSNIVKLRRHVRIHYEDKPFKCKVCNRGFPEMGALTRHFRLHTGEERERKHACTMCGKSYYDSHSLSVHIRTHTGEKPWVCKTCGKSFIDSRLLNSHSKVHSTEKQYACDRCGRKFTHHSTLISHIRTHTGEKPYVCYICKKSFIQSSNLHLHMRVHSGEKPYKCDICQRGFASSSTLTLHIRTHTGEKPYQCPQCGKSFARHSLNSHMRTHTGEKPFTCDKCSKRFTTSSQLNYHIRTHTGEKPYICDICDKRCSSSSYLKRHRKMHIKSSINNEDLNHISHVIHENDCIIENEGN